MAKTKEVTGELPSVDVKPSGEALADAVAQAKEVGGEHVTDTSNAKEVTEVGGTVIVRW